MNIKVNGITISVENNKPIPTKDSVITNIYKYFLHNNLTEINKFIFKLNINQLAVKTVHETYVDPFDGKIKYRNAERVFDITGKVKQAFIKSIKNFELQNY